MCDMSSKRMPCRPFHRQSRVEFIKKKFESSFLDKNNEGSVKQANATFRHNTKLLQELKDLNLNQKVVSSKTENVENSEETSKNEGKTFVKRSPAFRGEKFGSTKSLTRIPRQQKSETCIKLEQECQNENTKEKILKAEVCDVNILKEFKRSKTDSDLLKYCSDKNSERKISDSKPQRINSNLLTVGKDVTENSNRNDMKISAQYSVVSKKKQDIDKKEAVHLSESIRRALQSPLPKGPPPKKPPRTFCHTQQFIQTKSPHSSPSALSVTTAAITTVPPTNTSTASMTSITLKTDIPKLKSKLEKLEKAIKVHETGTHLNIPKKQFDKKIVLTPKKTESDSVREASSADQSCLPISICLSQSAKIYNLKKLSQAKSEFYFDVNKSNSLIDNGRSNDKSAGLASDDVNISDSEAIYDLPCLNKKNSFETFGKGSKYIKEAVNAKKAEDLHYMCTDVINQMPKYPDFFSNVNQKKHIKEENQALNLSRSYLLTKEANDKSQSMSNDSKRVTKPKEVYDRFNDSSDDSDLDLLSVKSSDSVKERQKGSAEGKNFSQTAAQRKIYVSRVSSKLMSQNPTWKYKNKSSYAHLFECCLVVGLTLCESKQNVPYIKSVFPPNTKPPPLIESLCFPDASYWPPNSENQQPEEQYYSLVVTNENGERKFGYCRRVLPEGGHICLPLTYCIISPHRAGGFFYKVLEELESKHGSPGVENFIKQLYESEFPGPGERLKLREILEEATETSNFCSDIYLSSTLIRRPPDVRLEEKDLTQLFQHLQLPVFLKIFSSLLHERKVLLLSNSLRNLSSCVEALQFVLLPFSWQHTYIPVLPTHLIELCEAPTPYVMGLLKPKNVEKTLSNINFEDGILVDLDESKILKCCGDEASILPARFIRNLKTSLHLAMNADDMSESDRNVLISDAFIRFFVQMCGNYYKFIVKLPCGEKIFQKENFIKSAVSSNTKEAFLDWFTETAMFNSFIQDRLHGDDEDMLVRLFSRRAMKYSEEGVKDFAVTLKNYKVINRKVKTLGDRIKDFTAFTK